MDRHLLLGGLIAAIILTGCSRDKSPPAEAEVQHKKEAQYKKKTTYDFPDDEVTGEMIRPEALDELPDRFAKSATLEKPSNLEPWDTEPTAYGYKGGDLIGVAERLRSRMARSRT